MLINQERSPGWIEIVLVEGLSFKKSEIDIPHLDGFWFSDWNPATIDWFRDDDVGVGLGEEIFVVQFVSPESEGEAVTTVHDGKSGLFTTKASPWLVPSLCQAVKVS